jgi:DNA (cytosine-5)-methyltransferase 1
VERGYVPYIDGHPGRAVPAAGRSHASFFSGVGGVDLGLERAGWNTVSFCEFAKYPSAVLAERWPDIPNLGDITTLGDIGGGDDRRERVSQGEGGDGRDPDPERVLDPIGWQHATLWTGGFPCQDLSIAGKREGLAGDRSGLAFTFFDLLDRYRDVPDRWVILENVQGLLSSHGGRDMARLVGTLGDLGFGWAYRCLDGRHFDVPQRRVRVFIVAHTIAGHPDEEGPGEVLAIGTRCRRHPTSGSQAGEEFASDPGGSTVGTLREHVRPGSNTDYTIVRQAISAKWSKGYGGPAGDEHHNLVDSTQVDPAGDGALDGVASRPHDLEELLPKGKDGHRYKACGNGVIAGKAEWLGTRLMSYLDEGSGSAVGPTT